mgnify:CR=1 FL=1
MAEKRKSTDLSINQDSKRQYSIKEYEQIQSENAKLKNENEMLKNDKIEGQNLTQQQIEKIQESNYLIDDKNEIYKILTTEICKIEPKPKLKKACIKKLDELNNDKNIRIIKIACVEIKKFRLIINLDDKNDRGIYLDEFTNLSSSSKILNDRKCIYCNQYIAEFEYLNPMKYNNVTCLDFPNGRVYPAVKSVKYVRICDIDKKQKLLCKACIIEHDIQDTTYIIPDTDRVK